MKLLIIANAVTTQSGARGVQAKKLINYLAQRNHVYLITDQVSKKSCKEELNVHTLLYAASIPALIKRFLRRVLGPVLTFDPIYICASISKARKVLHHEGIEVILTLSMDLSNAVIGVKLKKKFSKIVLHSYLSDPISDNSYLCVNKIEKLLYQNFEDQLCNLSDTIITPSLQTSEALKSRYGVYGCRFINIPHCYDSEPVASKGNAEGYILHLGSLNEKRTPVPILDEMVKSESLLREMGINGVQLIGPVSKKLKPRLVKRYKTHGWIKIRDGVPYYLVGELIGQAEVLMVIDAPMENSQFFPSKIVEYLPFGKPIIAVTPKGSETERVLKRIGHIVVNYEDISQLIFAIESAILMTRQKKQFFTEEFHLNSIGQLWEKTLNSKT